MESLEIPFADRLVHKGCFAWLAFGSSTGTPCAFLDAAAYSSGIAGTIFVDGFLFHLCTSFALHLQHGLPVKTDSVRRGVRSWKCDAAAAYLMVLLFHCIDSAYGFCVSVMVCSAFRDRWFFWAADAGGKEYAGSSDSIKRRK